MTNVEKIIFDAKYSVKLLNGKLVISGFNHLNAIHVDERKNNFKDIIESIIYFDESDWNVFVKNFNNSEHF